MALDPSTTKYMIKAKIITEGVVEKPDVVGAIFGQTEGLIGDELDLRDLQKSGRIGRIEVELKQPKGRSEGEITIPSSLDQVETAILASALETIDRVGPCKAKITVDTIDDVRIAKREAIIKRARELLANLIEKSKHTGIDLTDNVRQSVQVEEIGIFGPERLPCGPNVEESDTILVVEGRNDVLNLLKYGIKNAVAVEGTNIPKSIQHLTKEKTSVAFVDGDRGGDLILKELLQVSEIDFVARAPRGREVEELTQKQIMKALRNKIPVEQYIEMNNLNISSKDTNSDFMPISEKGDKTQNSERKQNSNHSSIDKSDLNEIKAYKKIFDKLSGKAVFLDNKDVKVKEMPIRDLRDQLKKKMNNVNTLIFDGIITQQIVDLASKAGIKTIVGMKMGNVTKSPPDTKIYTKSDF